MKIILTLLITISFIGCIESNTELKEIEITEDLAYEWLTETDKIVLGPISNAQIVWYDIFNRRYFVVIDSSLVYDYDEINEIASEIAELNKNEKTASISFFTDSKLADYKYELFEEKDPTFSSVEYQNWENINYLGELSFENKVYQTYPASTWRAGKRIEMKNLH